MDTIFLAIIALCLLVQVLFLVPMVVELRRALILLSKYMDDGLKPALQELQETLKSLRGVSDDVGGITSDVREVSKSLAGMAHTVSAVNAMLGAVGSSASARAAGLRAGIGAAIGYLAKNLIRKGDGK
jgi:uncharacterized protein YoxC